MSPRSMDDDPRADILLVDDSPEKLLTLEVILGGMEERLVTASSGREALRHLLSREFAVILLDVNMPGMDGFETAHLIRQRPSSESTPIIFITAFADDTHVRQGYSMGAVDYIIAPVIPEVLRSKVGVFVELYKKTMLLRRQARAMEGQARRLLELAETSLALNAAPTVQRVLDGATDAVRRILEADEAVGLVTLDAPGPRVFSAISGAAASGRDALLAQAAAHAAALGEPPERPGNALRDVLLHADGDGREAWLSAPLAVRSGRPLGWLHARRRAAERFAEPDASLLVQLAQTAALAIENLLSAEAREANRLKDEFLTTLSHELRTPLTAILGWTRLLRVESVTPDRAQHALEVIERNVNVQAKLIDDLLDVSRIVSGKLRLAPGPVSLPLVVQGAIEAMRPAAEGRGVTLELAKGSAPDLADPISGDGDRLQQVVLNLLSNAIKFTPRGGRVRVSLDRDEEGVLLVVSDSGKGIAPSFLPHVFDRFRQGDSSTTRVHGGLGVGLSLVRHIVELHGGTVTAASEGLDRGSTFTVRLPFAPASRSVVAMPGSTVERPTADLTGITVLLVDDESDAREVVREMLERAGAQVTTAASAAEALARIAARAPDVVVSDIAMPDGDGYSLVRAIRRGERGTSRRQAVIALSAYAREEDERLAMKHGFDRHVGKPVEPAELTGAVAEMAQAARVVHLPAPQAMRILLVEDNADTREALQSFLEMSGHVVQVAETGPEGIQKAIEEKPDVAFIDIGLPEMDGFEVARRIRDKLDGTARMTLIAVTGYDAAHDRSRARESGFDAFLPKPVNVGAIDGLLSGKAAKA